MTPHNYTLELRDDDGVLLAVLDEWISATWKRAANDPDQLTLRYPGSAWCAASLVNPNTILLYEGDARTLIAEFVVMARADESGIAHYITVECEGAIGKFARDIVVVHGLYASSPQYADHTIPDILALQTTLPTITAGTIAAAFETMDLGQSQYYSVLGGIYENVSIKAILDDLTRVCGGIMTVSGGALDWAAGTALTNAGHMIRLDNNATSISRKTDWRETDTDKQTTYQVGLINLADQGVAYNFDAALLAIGKPVRVVCASPAIDVDTVVSAIEIDLVTNGTSIAVSVPVATADGTSIIPRGYSGDVIDYIANAGREIEVGGGGGINVYTASAKAGLPSAADGSLGITTGTDKRYYARIDDTWICITHLEEIT